MGVFRVLFLIFSCFFSFSVFSQDGVHEEHPPDIIVIVPEDHTMLDLCFDQLLQRRLSLQEEMVTVSGEMKNAEGKEAVFSNYSDRIFQLVLRVNVLRFIEDAPINISENTCEEFIDKTLSDFEIKMVAIDNLFRSVMADTAEMVQYKFMEALEKQRRGMAIDENALEQLMQLMDREGFTPPYIYNDGPSYRGSNAVAIEDSI